ncbi:hypothetical protein ACFE04_004964 [Oxalis oulophora]
MSGACKLAMLARSRLILSSSPKSAASLLVLPRRGLSTAAGAAGSEHPGVPKVNFWEDPMHPSKWKRDQFVIVYTAGFGLLSYGAYKYYFEDKYKDKNQEMQQNAGQRTR